MRRRRPRRTDVAAVLLPRLRDARGFGLVELLIALLVLNVGIMAMLAAFSSGAVTLRAASMTSTASAIAEIQMEEYRGMSWDEIPLGSSTVVREGPDGRSYRLEIAAVERSEDPVATAEAAGVGWEVKVVSVRVVDVASGRTVITAESTFDRSVGA